MNFKGANNSVKIRILPHLYHIFTSMKRKRNFVKRTFSANPEDMAALQLLVTTEVSRDSLIRKAIRMYLEVDKTIKEDSNEKETLDLNKR